MESSIFLLWKGAAPGKPQKGRKEGRNVNHQEMQRNPCSSSISSSEKFFTWRFPNLTSVISFTMLTFHLFLCIFLTSEKHFLKCNEGWGQQEAVITIAYNAMVVVIYPAACSSIPQDLEQVINIKAIQNCRKYCALSDTIT